MSTKGLYHDLIIDHYKNPRNFGVLENPDATAQEANASCGDLIEFQIKIKKIQNSEFPARSGYAAGVAGGRIQNLAWRGVGCAISTAGASLLSEKIQNSEFRIQNLMTMTDKDMIKMVGGEISHARIKCVTLPLFALQKAVRQFSNITI